MTTGTVQLTAQHMARLRGKTVAVSTSEVDDPATVPAGLTRPVARRPRALRRVAQQQPAENKDVNRVREQVMAA